MTDIKTTGLQGSLSGLAAGIVASQLTFAQPHAGQSAPYIEVKLLQSSYGEYSDLFSASRLVEIALASSMRSFYTDLLIKQERLGPELEDALFSNLWNLYAR